MVVRFVIALVVLGLLICCFSAPGLSQTPGHKDTPDLTRSDDAPDATETPSLGEVEAKVRRLELGSPKGAAYDNALTELYDAYVQAERDAEALGTARKLWRLREQELKASDPLTIDAMQRVAESLVRDKSGAGDAEAGRILEEALSRLSSLSKRRPAAEVSVLEQMAHLQSVTQPQGAAAELKILERITGIIERNVEAFDRDSLRAHRLRIKQFRDRLREPNTPLKERALAVGRRAWLAHEAFTIKRWEAYRRTNKAWQGKDQHPAEAVTQFYTDKRIGEGERQYIFFIIPVGRAIVFDDSVDDRERAAKALEVLPRVVETELKFTSSKGSDALRASVSAIMDAAAHAGEMPGVREKLANAGKLLLAMTLESSGRYSPEHLEALDQLLSAYNAAAPGAAAEITAERDAVSRALQAKQLLKEAIRRFYSGVDSPQPGNTMKAKLLEAVDRYMEALGKDAKLADVFDSEFSEELEKAPFGVRRDGETLVGGLPRSTLRDFRHERFAALERSYDTQIEVMDHLFKTQGPGSQLALDFANHVMSALLDNGREYEAFLVGKRIAPMAEKAFGVQAPLVEAIVMQILPAALKFANDAERQDWLAKAERMKAPDNDRLVQILLRRGATQQALHMTRQKIRSALRTDFTTYELLTVLGTQSDLAAYADMAEAEIATLLDGKTDRSGWLFPRTAEDLQFLRPLRRDLLGYPRTLRGACDAGLAAGDRIAAARDELIKVALARKQELKLSYAFITVIGFEKAIERATMDCLVRSGRSPEAVNLVKSSTLFARLNAAAAKGKLVESVSPDSDLRTALVLASASDWPGAERLLKRLVTARKTAAAHLVQDVLSGRCSSEPVEMDADSTFLDTLAALKYAPDMRASQLMGAAYLKALWRTKGSTAGRDDIDRAFQLAQRTEFGVAVAIARMAARSIGGPELAAKVRQHQNLEDEEERLISSGLEDAVHELRKVARKRVEIEAEICHEHPEYFEQIKPRALGLNGVQKLLAQDEALVFTFDMPALLSTPEETFIIMVTQKEVRWARSALGTEGLKREVAALRCGLDDEEWAEVSKAARCGDLLGRAGMPDLSEPLPFHLGRAHSLYKALFGDIEKFIAGKRLLVVPSGPLTSLPLSVLVALKPRHELPDTYEQYFDVAWLGTRNALVTLPAVSSLARLRAQLPDDPRKPVQYAGYGNPVLVGEDFCGASKIPDLNRDCPSPDPGAFRTATGEARITMRGRGTRRSGQANIDWMYASGTRSAAVLERVRKLCPLPDTEYEIRCVAGRFAESDRLLPLRLQEKATERDIKSLSQSGELARYRILHFATHGLVSGDVRQITDRDGEPALVLTPPETPASLDDDGLLTASEVAALKLNADWVVLSACNTAAGEEIGAEALSGLARSFFYAGARSLLVSHWPVYSDAAVRLATRAFAELDPDRKIWRAEALQRAMKTLMTDRSDPRNAHPLVWAPFVLVGEAGKR